ncbi:MAG TPA: LPS export ABC transporter permease LptF [Burkholderiales bacterium]|nr:LPS export ABC transporter permease LptF [Burkholderiales bacterium]
MIFQRALLREFGNLALAVFSALFAITLTTQLVRLLGQAAVGNILSEAVAALLAFAALNYLPVLLSLTLFISILMTLSRSYRESEMVVWFSSGLSLLAWVRPVLTFAAPLVALTAVLSLFLSPWAIGKAEEYRHQMKVRDEVSRVAPGVFLEAPAADRVFFVEEIAGDQTKVQSVFIAQMKEGRLGITVSRRGYRELAENGDRLVVLLDGRRYEGIPGNLDFKVMNFERYAMKVETQETQAEETSTKAMSTWGLILAPSNPHLAELLWRIGLPIGALVLALLAIPLSFVNPRASRSVNLLFALFTYMVYANMLSIVQAWVSQGRIGFNIGWWVVHAGMLSVLALLFYRRIRVGSMFSRKR